MLSHLARSTAPLGANIRDEREAFLQEIRPGASPQGGPAGAALRHSAQPESVSAIAIYRHLLGALLPLPRVQFWETENSWRLDNSRRGGHCGDISCLVDASDVRTLNASKPLRRGQ